jgi:phage/plasmid-like protein (TIGR03299 family)
MAHDLHKSRNGQFSFAYALAHGKGWHGLGQPMADSATLDEWTTAAGMDWLIQSAPVEYTGRDGWARMPGKVVLYRGDDGAPLAVVGDGFKIVQPREIMEFFRGLMRGMGLEMSAAGVIDGGRRFWATARIGEGSPIPGDRIGSYVLVSTGCDGTIATEWRVTTIRVVCRNTLTAATCKGAGKPTGRLTHRSAWDAAEAQKDLGLAVDAWEKFRSDMAALADVSMSTEDARETMIRLIGGPTPAGQDKARKSPTVANISRLFDGAAVGSDIDGTRGTAYGLLQAVTEHVDHHGRARTYDANFMQAQWGPGAVLKDRTFAHLLTMTKPAPFVSLPDVPTGDVDTSGDFARLLGVAA